jgi:hypothetical protein
MPEIQACSIGVRVQQQCFEWLVYAIRHRSHTPTRSM